MPKTIDDLRALGYEVGVAHGDVAPEIESLDEAREAAAPEAMRRDAEPIIARSIETFMSLAAVHPNDPQFSDAAVGDFIARITEQSLRMLGQQRNADVDLYERSVEVAKSMPTVYVISGPGVVNLYVATNEDGTGADAQAQEILDSLCDEAAHTERSFQHHAPDEVVATVIALRGAGEEVEAEATDKNFTVKFGGKSYRSAETLAKAAKAKLTPDGG